MGGPGEATGPFSRYSLAGWVFVLVLLVEFLQSGKVTWTDLLGSLKGIGDSPLWSVVLGAVVGLSAPPALGFVLTSTVTSVHYVLELRPAWYGWLGDRLPQRGGGPGRGKPIPRLPPNGTAVAKTRVQFYTLAHDNLLAWWEHERVIMYASLSSLLAIVLAWIVAASVGALSVLVTAVTLIIVVGLGTTAWGANQETLRTREAWYRQYGRDDPPRPPEAPM